MEDFERTHARADDPSTSKQAATHAAYRAGSHKDLLLAAYASSYPYGLTDEEAAILAGLEHTGYWKRCSDLRSAGDIVPMVKKDGSLLTYMGSSGTPVMVCKYNLGAR